MSFAITVTKSMSECSCLTFCNFGLPCRHIFACRKQFKNTVYDETLIPDRWRKEFEKQDNDKPVFIVQTSTLVNKTPSKKHNMPKSVIEKFNKAYDLCRDIAQFLSTCGENEFQEKMTVLNTLKSEWQCSQVTKGLDKDIHKQEATPLESDDCLTEFQYGKIKTTLSSGRETISDNNTSKDNIDHSKSEDTTEESNPMQNEISDVLDLDDIRLDPVKSRRGRPKGTKKPFWNFSKKSSVTSKKRKATEKEENTSKKLKVEEYDSTQNDQTTKRISVSKYSLNSKDKHDIENKELLNDKIIDAAQEIMKNQFTTLKINGFQSVLNKQRADRFDKVEKDTVQILHRGSVSSGHWFTISTLNCPEGTVNVFDSMYTDIDQVANFEYFEAYWKERSAPFDSCPTSSWWNRMWTLRHCLCCGVKFWP